MFEPVELHLHHNLHAGDAHMSELHVTARGSEVTDSPTASTCQKTIVQLDCSKYKVKSVQGSRMHCISESFQSLVRCHVINPLVVQVDEVA